MAKKSIESVNTELETQEAAVISETATAPEIAVPPASKPAPETTIYIGPTLRGIATGTLYIGGKLAPALEAAIAAAPVVGELVVPVSGLPAARRQLQDKASALSTFYEAAKKLKR